MIDLTGKIVLLTGASRGIGAATALTLSRAGAQVILHYGQGKSEAEAIAQTIGVDQCCLIQTDLAVPLATRTLWQEAIAWKGRIDVVINNAATMPEAGIESDWNIWSSTWQTTLQVNLMAVADLCREAIVHFQARQGGILINLASRAAFRGDGIEYMHYAASKGGIIALTRSIARGFAKDKILAYAIAPGFVRTERTEQVMQERGAEYVTRDIPLGEPASPQDVANTIAFLAAGLAPHATGSTIDINGASYVR
jgi:3-oxoacyl-[acyl-carrier protein] reductase